MVVWVARLSLFVETGSGGRKIGTLSCKDDEVELKVGMPFGSYGMPFGPTNP